jgi:hypothetical protein
MNNQSINLLAGNVLMASRAIPDPAWTVSEKDGGAIMDARGEMVLYPLDLITTEEVLNLLKNVCFIRNAAPILASRAARAVRIAQELTEALDRIKHTSDGRDAYDIAVEALAKAAAFGINPRGRENSVK